MATDVNTTPVLTTNKEGKEFLSIRAAELKQNGTVSPAVRAVFQAIIRDVQPKYITAYGPRDTVGILDVMHDHPIPLEYTYNRRSLHRSLRSRPIETGRSAPPSGNVKFDDVFDAAWQLLVEAIDEYGSTATNPAR